jgi:glycosyltransferase involved in cell wall biosynthesis
VRNEEDNVADCLAALAAATARPEILVVDDGSTDRTAALLAAASAREYRIRVVPAGPLPPGWPGKVYALWVGEAAAETDWLLLTDADTRHSPDLLARAHTVAAQSASASERPAAAGDLVAPFAAVSLSGTQEAKGLGENLLTAAVFALLDALLPDWEAAAAGAGPALANGQFILLQRAAWTASGGFESIREAPIDDVALAARLRAHGFRTAFLRAPALRVRMYRGARETIRGWRRNLGALFGARPRVLATALVVLLLPPLGLALALATGHWVEAWILWTAGAASSALLRLGANLEPAYGLLYPLDALLLAAVLALGARDRRRGRLASWKGRTVEV